jgi:hypothetical protein
LVSKLGRWFTKRYWESLLFTLPSENLGSTACPESVVAGAGYWRSFRDLRSSAVGGIVGRGVLKFTSNELEWSMLVAKLLLADAGVGGIWTMSLSSL